MSVPTDDWVNEADADVKVVDEAPAAEPENKKDEPAGEAEKVAEGDGKDKDAPTDTDELPPEEVGTDPDVDEDEPPADLTDPKQKKAFYKLRAKQREEREARIRAEERLAALEEMANKTPAAPAETQAAPDDDPEPIPPKEADFDSLADYEKAMFNHNKEVGAWSARNEFRRLEREREAREAAMRADANHKKYVETATAKIEEAIKEYPDFKDAVVNNKALAETFAVAPHLRDGMIEAEGFAHLAYYYAKRPSELAKLAGMSKERSLIEIGKMEARLSAHRAKEPSKAVPPIKPTESAGSLSPEADEDKMTTEQWMKHEQKRLAKKRAEQGR